MAQGPSGHGDAPPVDRRSFIGTLSLVLGGVLGLAGTVVAAVFAVAPALKRGAAAGDQACPAIAPSTASSNGPRLETVPVMQSSGWSESHLKQAVWVDEGEDGTPRVFSARCPHEGCRVDWRPNTNEYVCPCHDSRFTREGARLQGPVKRGLDPLPARRKDDGSIEVCYKTFALDTADRIEVG
jgi:menaquinol-cytochrome c reductase iron-sulfur subunit